ncbi:hypothetical protein BX070DRAFT_230239 [Coemansia spiralis]|nr:hypothetical protein BX070DRAFT_230239 [Coemansia spiralis]
MAAREPTTAFWAAPLDLPSLEVLWLDSSPEPSLKDSSDSLDSSSEAELSSLAESTVTVLDDTSTEVLILVDVVEDEAALLALEALLALLALEAEALLLAEALPVGMGLPSRVTSVMPARTSTAFMMSGEMPVATSWTRVGLYAWVMAVPPSTEVAWLYRSVLINASVGRSPLMMLVICAQCAEISAIVSTAAAEAASASRAAANFIVLLECTTEGDKSYYNFKGILRPYYVLARKSKRKK